MDKRLGVSTAGLEAVAKIKNPALNIFFGFYWVSETLV
jgi:hypothetical protein